MREERAVTRRATLERIALAGTAAGLAGCLATSVREEPDPRVVRAEPTDLTDINETRTIDVRVLVHNVGTTGEVVVTVETFVGGGREPVETASTTLTMESDSQTAVMIPIEVSAVAVLLEATAEPAEATDEPAEATDEPAE